MSPASAALLRVFEQPRRETWRTLSGNIYYMVRVTRIMWSPALGSVAAVTRSGSPQQRARISDSNRARTQVRLRVVHRLDARPDAQPRRRHQRRRPTSQGPSDCPSSPRIRAGRCRQIDRGRLDSTSGPALAPHPHRGQRRPDPRECDGGAFSAGHSHRLNHQSIGGAGVAWVKVRVKVRAPRSGRFAWR